MKKGLLNLIEYEYYLLHDKLIEQFSTYRDAKDHYYLHVCQSYTNKGQTKIKAYTGKEEFVTLEDGSRGAYRILMPYMEFKKYVWLENNFLNNLNVGKSNVPLTDNNIIGWVTSSFTGKHTNNDNGLYVKFRKSKLAGPKEDGLIEYLVYEPEFSDELYDNSETYNADDGTVYSYKVKNRTTISYGLCRRDDLEYVFKKIGELPYSERVHYKQPKSDNKSINYKNDLHEARQQTALKSNGVYSVLNDTWIKEPVAEDIPEVDKEAFDKLFNEWKNRYLDIIKGEELAIDSDTIIESQSVKSLYTYEGPIYRFKRFVKNTYLETMAVSLKQAINNLKFKAASEIGFNRANGANIDIRADLVTLVDDFNHEEEIGETDYMRYLKCPKCNKVYLNDAGECPLCDLGDESVLDESVETSLQYRIEEIEDFIEDIYDLRKESIKNDGEYGIGNLVFKELRNSGYLDNLRDLKNILKSKKLSLESLNK